MVWQLLGAALGGIGAASRQRKQNKEAQRAYDRTRRDTVADYYRQRADNQADFWMQHTASKNLLDYQLGANRTDAQIREQNRYEWLVEGAQRAGFNPLTALGATGAQLSGGGQASMAALSPVTLATTPAPVLGAGPTTLETLGSVISAMEDPIDKEARRLRNELYRQEIQTEKNNRTRLGQLPVMRRTASPVETSNDPNPDYFGTGFNPQGDYAGAKLAPPSVQPFIEVFVPFGKNRTPRSITVPGPMADRFQWRDGESLTMGDLTELFGEPAEVIPYLDPNDVIQFFGGQNLYTDYRGFSDETHNERLASDVLPPRAPPDGYAPDGSPDTPAKYVYRQVLPLLENWWRAPLQHMGGW